jgi:hypothetical protein
MKVLLIDLENCPSQINELLENLVDYSQVVICYAQSGAKIPIDWILPLTKVVNDDHLKIIKMPTIGKNAADFGIAFLAGVLMEKSAKKTHFDIVSNDTDLDFVIDLLKLHKRSAKRIAKPVKEKVEAIKLVQEVKSQEIIKVEAIKPIQDIKVIAKPKTTSALQTYCSHLAKYPNKPAKQKTLLNSIKSKFQNKVVSEELLAELVKIGVITINNEKISYNLQKINTFKIQD